MSFDRRQFVSKGILAIGAAAFLPSAQAAGSADPEKDVLDFVSGYGEKVTRSAGSKSGSVELVTQVRDMDRMRHALSDFRFGKIRVQENTVSFMHRDVRFTVRHISAIA